MVLAVVLRSITPENYEEFEEEEYEQRKAKGDKQVGRGGAVLQHQRGGRGAQGDATPGAP